MKRFIVIFQNFVGEGDSTFTVKLIPSFDSFSDYLSYLFQNISTSIIGPLHFIRYCYWTNIIIRRANCASSFNFYTFKKYFKVNFKPKFRLSKGLTDFSIMILFLLLYSLLGYVNFLAGWRFQSGSWILFILMYLKISKI